LRPTGVWSQILDVQLRFLLTIEEDRVLSISDELGASKCLVSGIDNILERCDAIELICSML